MKAVPGMVVLLVPTLGHPESHTRPLVHHGDGQSVQLLLAPLKENIVRQSHARRGTDILRILTVEYYLPVCIGFQILKTDKDSLIEILDFPYLSHNPVSTRPLLVFENNVWVVIRNQATEGFIFSRDCSIWQSTCCQRSF